MPMAWAMSSGRPAVRRASMRERNVISVGVGAFIAGQRRWPKGRPAGPDISQNGTGLQARCYSVPVSGTLWAPMDPRLLETLAKRLGENPNDTEALNVAYEQGQTDPRSYAVFLEKAGAASVDPVYAAHWLNEAATVWSVSLGDQHRAARTLMAAVDKDPTAAAASDRLLEMYREKGDHKSVAALFDRRTKHLEKLVTTQPELQAPL